MSNLAVQIPRLERAPETPYARASADTSTGENAKNLYFDLLDRKRQTVHADHSKSFLFQHLARVRNRSDIPEDPAELMQWNKANTERVGSEYAAYLRERRAGAPRRYFSGKAHALYFLKGVAPTKLVDGAWLYGLFEHWEDDRFRPLLQTYLEELGEGDPQKNHVVLYRRLLATHGCEQWTRLSDNYFVQGAIQLALARHTRHFLPEVIGYNLGYEQLPLHLLITSYELNELGIDPYYFTLHVTIDNADSGHAKKALQGVLDALPEVGDSDAFYQRVRNGYVLNSLGASTSSVISEFDLEAELIDLLSAKAWAGSCLHSDYVRVGGRTINQWLSEPGAMPQFLGELQRMGWIRRHEDPSNSSFWRLIEGETAEMHGVFTSYEQQVIYDWIAGDWSPSRRTPTFTSTRAAQRRQAAASTASPAFRNRDQSVSDFGAEHHLFTQKLASFSDSVRAMEWLIALISPARHHTPAGLLATQAVCRMLNAGH